jgi:DNA-binding XRE family transcriptional regulator
MGKAINEGGCRRIERRATAASTPERATSRNRDRTVIRTSMARIRVEQRNLTQSEVALAAGIPLKTYATIESGRNDNPSIRQLIGIARALGVELALVLEPHWFS